MKRRAFCGAVLLLALASGCAREVRRYPALQRAFQAGWQVHEELDCHGRSVLRFVSPDGSSHLLGARH